MQIVADERCRAMTPAERAAVVAELNNAADEMARAGILLRYPDADEREIFLRLTALKIGRDLMVQAYGWDPDVEGW